MKILVTPISMQPGKCNAALEQLMAFSEDLVFNPTGRPLAGEELIQLLQDCEGYIAGLDFITAEVMDACPKLKVISRYGVGYDRIDIQAAAERGIVVTNTPGVNAEAVGEMTFGLILAAARQIPYLDRCTRQGEWIRSTGMELKGKILGIMGLGAVGKVVARCGQGLGMKVIAYDPSINAEYCWNNAIDIVSREKLITDSDVITLHLPLSAETYHLINTDSFSAMKRGTILINVAHGGLIDEEAAYEALKNGRLGGLGLDAFETEPPEHSRLFEFSNVVATPHAAAHTKEAMQDMAQMTVSDLIAVLSGKDCLHIVNK